MNVRNPLYVAVLSLMTMAIVGCGGDGGGRQKPPPPAPTFASTPGMAAVEGNAYTYTVTATDPMGGAVTLALASGPAGAVMDGNTLTWTPTGEESRVADNFRVTATTAEGGTGSQSWSVTPAGTVHISRVNTNWTAAGSTAIPFDWTANPVLATEVAVLLPQTDGSFATLTGTGNADGTLDIPNVPGGYYWLRMTPLAIYWTSTSHFDWGTDAIEPTTISIAPAPNPLPTTVFDINVSGLDPWQAQDALEVNLDNGFSLGASGFITAGATTANLPITFGTSADLTKAKSAIVSQLETAQAGPLAVAVLGPTLQLTDLNLTNGGTNTFAGVLSSVPKSTVDLNVKGSAWAELYNNAGPATVTAYDTAMRLSVQPYFTGGISLDPLLGENSIPPLFYTNSSIGPLVTALALPNEPCGSLALPDNDNGTPPRTGQPPIQSDEDLGTIQFQDPFTPTWLRPFTFCQEAVVSIADASAGSPITFLLADGEVTSTPTGVIAPLVAQVQNPQINGRTLFTAGTVSGSEINFSWTAPAGTAPTAYEVQILIKTTIQIPSPPAPTPQTFTAYLPTVRLYSTKTSVALPYALAAGQNFLVEIRSLYDGRANYETSPLRNGLPEANTSIVSAVMTVGADAGAQKNAIKIKPAALTMPVWRDVRGRNLIFPNQP